MDISHKCEIQQAMLVNISNISALSFDAGIHSVWHSGYQISKFPGEI